MTDRGLGRWLHHEVTYIGVTCFLRWWSIVLFSPQNIYIHMYMMYLIKKKGDVYILVIITPIAINSISSKSNAIKNLNKLHNMIGLQFMELSYLYIHNRRKCFTKTSCQRRCPSQYIKRNHEIQNSAVVNQRKTINKTQLKFILTKLKLS